MIKKGDANLYNSTNKSKLAVRNLVKGFHKLTGDKILYLAVDYDLGKDFIFGEDTFPSIVAVYKNIFIRTEDGKPLNLSRVVNPFGYQLANSKPIYLSMDLFYEETLKQNEEIEYLKGTNWIPRNSDLIIDTETDKIYKVNSVDENEGEQFAKDRNVWKIVLVPYTLKNINSSVVEGQTDLPNHDNIMASLNAVFGTTAIDMNTQEPEEINQMIKSDDVKHDIYELDVNGNVILTKSREDNLGVF